MAGRPGVGGEGYLTPNSSAHFVLKNVTKSVLFSAYWPAGGILVLSMIWIASPSRMSRPYLASTSGQSFGRVSSPFLRAHISARASTAAHPSASGGLLTTAVAQPL